MSVLPAFTEVRLNRSSGSGPRSPPFEKTMEMEDGDSKSGERARALLPEPASRLGVHAQALVWTELGWFWFWDLIMEMDRG